MECNKEEAVRAMDIAKRKVTENDYIGARAFAIKAQNLYPQLDGLKQVLMLIDVYISAGNKICGGESDWYGVLGVDPLADDGAVKKQYRKLALLLHPDKNKCEGAEGAFKLVLEAWSLLSDKVKRIAFDQKRALMKQVKPRKSRKQKQPPNQRKQSAKQQKQPPKQPKQPPNQKQQPPNQQEQQPPNQQKQPPNQEKQPPNQQEKQPPKQEKQPPNQQKKPPSPQKQPPNQPSSNGSRNDRGRSNKPTSKVSTFWTMCNKCSTQHEYVRVFYLNKAVICRNCQGSFKATEKDKTPQATNENTHGASCGSDSLSKMASSNSGNVASQPEKRVVEESEEKEEEAAKGIANSDFKVEERVLKKLRTDGCSGIKV